MEQNLILIIHIQKLGIFLSDIKNLSKLANKLECILRIENQLLLWIKTNYLNVILMMFDAKSTIIRPLKCHGYVCKLDINIKVTKVIDLDYWKTWIMMKIMHEHDKTICHGLMCMNFETFKSVSNGTVIIKTKVSTVIYMLIRKHPEIGKTEMTGSHLFKKLASMFFKDTATVGDFILSDYCITPIL